MKNYSRNPKAPPPLFIINDGIPKETGTFACGECGLVYASAESARYCCLQQICADCGADAPKAWVLCDRCRDAKRINSATEVKPEDYEGPVYHEPTDRYFSDYEYAVDHFMEDEEDDRPEWLFACKTDPCPKLDLDDILENLTCDLFEDAVEHLKGVKELKKAIDKFNKSQTLTSWHADYTRKIKFVVPKEDTEGEE